MAHGEPALPEARFSRFVRRLSRKRNLSNELPLIGVLGSSPKKLVLMMVDTELAEAVRRGIPSPRLPH